MVEDGKTILLVEDEPAQREVLAYNLQAVGFDVLTAKSGDEAQIMLSEALPDLVVLDWMLPGLSGIELCRQLRARAETQQLPIIMVTARGEEADKVRGLDTGADDYLSKPYSVSELVARIRALLRRSTGVTGEILEHGRIQMHLAQHRVTVNEKPVALGPLEYKLLKLFLERPGRVFSRDQLLDRVWGQDIFVDSRTVDVHIGRLRKSLGPEAEDPIRTVRGAGYSLG
jgi:two-component system phosphate regulon response regulator PhoB